MTFLFIFFYIFAENIALKKAVHYITYEGSRKNANVVVDGLHDGNCLSLKGSYRPLGIDLGEILSIHHVSLYFEDSSGYHTLGIYLFFLASINIFAWLGHAKMWKFGSVNIAFDLPYYEEACFKKISL